MRWAGTVVVLIGKETSKSDYVNWEIETAAGMGKIKDFSNVEIEEAINKADAIIEENQKQDIGIVTYLDEEYPKRTNRLCCSKIG